MPKIPVKPANAVPFPVRVKAKKRSSGKYDIWIPGWLDFPREKLKFNKSDLGMEKTQVHWVEFQLQNLSGANLRFHPDLGQVFWIEAGASCPTKACGVQGVEPKYSCDDLLIVQNDNMSVASYRFTINLLEPGDDGKDPSTFIPFDPGWDNRNSGFSGPGGLTTARAIGIVALGTAAVAGLAWLLRGGRGPADSKGRGGRGD